MAAVLSFLRQEGEQYDEIARRAGAYHRRVDGRRDVAVRASLTNALPPRVRSGT
jgi:hypothetical protein